jgi:hypothetical protein
MPLFPRSDGVVVRGLSPVRRMIPYLMRGRNESLIYYEQILDVTRTLEFVRSWNATRPEKVSVFDIVIAACGKALLARPGLNRFVSGGRIYQRRGCFVSFAAKKRFEDDAPLSTVKLEMHEAEPLGETARRIHEAVVGARSDRERPVDKEVRLVLKLPGVLLRIALALVRLLDRWNLMPKSMIRNDPLYASLFLANLGSVGIDRAWHHLYEYGTVSLFGILGEVKKRPVTAPDGTTSIRDTVRMRFSFDERINDGFYCAASLGVMREYVEDPELFETRPVPPAERPARPRPSAQ